MWFLTTSLYSVEFPIEHAMLTHVGCEIIVWKTNLLCMVLWRTDGLELYCELGITYIRLCTSLKTLWRSNFMPPSRSFNTLRPKQYGRHFSDDSFNRIFLNEHVKISIEISQKFVPGGPNKNIPTLVQIMAWRRPGDKPLSEPMMVRLPTHICVIRSQWVKTIAIAIHIFSRCSILLLPNWKQRQITHTVEVTDFRCVAVGTQNTLKKHNCKINI